MKFTAFACAAALSLAVPGVQAQEWPSRAITLVAPYTPGTGADILARLLGPRLSEKWKVPVVTENRVGAAGTIGVTSATCQVEEVRTQVMGGKARGLAKPGAARRAAEIVLEEAGVGTQYRLTETRPDRNNG